MSHDKGNYRNKRRGNFHNKNRNPINVGDKGREVLEGIDENNPVIKQFQEYAKELDTKHDRFERIVKVSRDVTIESKRIIFLLHTLDRESKRNNILSDAETRLNSLITGLFKNIALELDGEDAYIYLRAYRPGLQEFIEAITFYWYLQNSTLYHWTNLEESMKYDKASTNNEEESSDRKTIEKSIQTIVPPVEYILGIADLTGELMRKCINNLASGDISSCYETCNFVRKMYTGFLGCTWGAGKEVSRKIFTLKQSLLKMENVCYMIRVRGSEIPKHMLADVAISAAENVNVDDDEGYQVY
ncbi:hypothetical protein QAD02_004053 [Eretmocerus hayati]|uniref:Uncharacterized protein n=1 Tax=Eretmocerus hayati TaxID=131215 RepID=A0ACC2NPJ5_9HYME|nr:hypothetical protein QAD02_004053 [Eretmocerus hayati]